MKVLFDSYSTITQNASGGVSIRMKKTAERLQPFADIRLFDKWEDKIEEYDILHIFKASIDTYSAVCHAKKKGVKVVVSSVVDPTKSVKLYLNRLAASVLRQHNSYAIFKKTFDAAHAVMCQTVKEKAFVSEMYAIKPEKIFVIPSAMDGKKEEASEEYFRKKTGIEGRFILQVGRFDPNKNQLSTIRAVEGTDMQLVLVGGPDKGFPDYYEKCKKEAGENVHFLGWIDHSDPLLCSAYAAAHTFIIPSHHEIFGNTLFESGMYGCNIVATRALPLESWGIDSCCLSVNPASVEDIRKKLQMSLGQERSGEISKIVERDFSWESVIKKYLDVYNYVLGKDEVK